jgi:hypothetical protein
MAFRDLILNNFRRKLFALLLAILIWTTIHFADPANRWWERGSEQTNSMTFPR